MSALPRRTAKARFVFLLIAVVLLAPIFVCANRGVFWIGVILANLANLYWITTDSGRRS